MPALSTLTDTFPGTTLAAQWSANGGGVAAGSGYVNVAGVGGNPTYSQLYTTAATWTFNGSTVSFYDVAMPGPAGVEAYGQLWVIDPVPAATVDRFGFEYRVAANELDFIGQTGTNYAPIGTTTTLTYDPVAHRNLRIQHTGTSIVWSTSPDGLTWTVRRTLSTIPAWANKTTLRVSIEGFRYAGANDVLRVGAVNVAPPALPTTAPVGQDALQRRTLTELRAWRSWLAANSAPGWVGEFNGVTLATKYGDTVQGAKWDALLDAYLTELDVDAIHGTVWASGREWGEGYPLGVHVGTNVGDPLTIANAGASAVIAGHPSRAGRWHGVNLSGWEQGITINGGGTVRSTAGYVHTAADFAFLAANGVDLVRLPFAWERLQPTLGAALSTSALATLDGMLTAARQYGIRVVLDLHNYGRYTQANGTTVVALGDGISNAQFSDLWTRLSTWVRASTSRSQTVIAYDLMNEPHDLTGGATTWEASSQAAVTAIRGGGDTRLLLVEGYTFASLTEWATWHPTGWVTDPQNNFAYSAHHYWDTTSALGARSGTYQQSPTGPITTYAIELQAAEAAEAGAEAPPVPDRVQLCTNPSLETSAAGHTILARRGTSTTLAPAVGAVAGRSSTIDAAAGGFYGFVNVTGPGTTSTTPDATIALPPFAVTPGLQYAVGAARCVSSAANGPTDRVAVVWKDSNGDQIGARLVGSTGAVTAAWGRKSVVQLTAPAGAVTCAPELHYFAPADTTLRSYRWDAVLYEQHSEASGKAYFDGTSTGASWDGIQHASTSRISGVTVHSGAVIFSAGAALAVGTPALEATAAATMAARATVDADGVRSTTGEATFTATAELAADPYLISEVNYGTFTATATMDPVAVGHPVEATLSARAAVAADVDVTMPNAATIAARAEVLGGTFLVPALGSAMLARAELDATGSQTFSTTTGTLAARARLAAVGQREQASEVTFAAVAQLLGAAYIPYAAAANLSAVAVVDAGAVRSTSATALLRARARMDPSDTGARPGFATLTATAQLDVATSQIAVAAATLSARAHLLSGTPVTALLSARPRLTASGSRGHYLAGTLAARAAMNVDATRGVPRDAVLAARALFAPIAVIATPAEAVFTARGRLLVGLPVLITPVFRIPAGPVKPQTDVPVTRLLVADTVTGRVHYELPFTALSWSSPLNKIGTAQATIPIEATLEQMYAQGANSPRNALRAVLLGPYRYSLAVCYGNVAVWGGPLLPTEDEDDQKVTIAGAAMERILEKRVLLNRGVAGELTAAVRDITINNTNVRRAVYGVVQEAMIPYNGTRRQLPITCSSPPGPGGEENFTWLSYDLNKAWKAVTDLAARPDGPDVRLEPYLREGNDGVYVNWDLQIGDPTFDVAPGNFGPHGPLPWTWDDSTCRIKRSIDATGMASTYYSAGGGQDRAKKIGSSQDDTLAYLGFPVLEEVDSAGASEEDPLKVQARAAALNRAHHLPTDSWSLQVPVDGDPPLGSFRRGDVARIETRHKLLIEPGDYLRRITQVSGDASGWASVSCDYEDELAGV